MDLDELDRTCAEAKATYQEIQNYVCENYGFKVSTLYIAQVKSKLGLEIGESYNQAKSDKPKVPVCPQEKEKAITDALRYFGMTE